MLNSKCSKYIRQIKNNSFDMDEILDFLSFGTVYRYYKIEEKILAERISELDENDITAYARYIIKTSENPRRYFENGTVAQLLERLCEIDEVRGPHDYFIDGVLAWGVCIGRVVFRDKGVIVYVISDTPHIGPSDTEILFQIDKSDYSKLLAKSEKHRIPEPPVEKSETDKTHRRLLASASRFHDKNSFCADDTDLTLTDEYIESCFEYRE